MILVIGKNGQLASSFRKLLASETVYWGSSEIPVVDRAVLLEKLRQLKPSLIINTAAYTAVDKAESDEDSAFRLNALLPEVIGNYAKSVGIPVIHFSTDYVFDGSGTAPWTEDAKTGPISVYGRTKLDGEELLLKTGAHSFIFRTSWVYSSFGSNFVKTILRLAAERETLKIVADQFGSPTFSDDLAVAVVSKLNIFLDSRNQLSGVYHLTGEGYTSWYEFAVAIVKEARQMGWDLKVKEILPIPSNEYPTPAKRPLNSKLAQEKVREKLGILMPEWRNSLKECLTQLKRNL